jgi:hypothetical protein
VTFTRTQVDHLEPRYILTRTLRKRSVCRLDQSTLPNVRYRWCASFYFYWTNPTAASSWGYEALQNVLMRDFCECDNVAYKALVVHQIRRFIHAIVLTRESLRASRFRALEVLFTGVYPVMSGNVARGGKSLSACGTFVAALAASGLIRLRAGPSTVARDKTATIRVH